MNAQTETYSMDFFTWYENGLIIPQFDIVGDG